MRDIITQIQVFADGKEKNILGYANLVINQLYDQKYKNCERA